MWGRRSKRLLAQVHPDLQRWCDALLARSPYDVTVRPSTIRTIAEQRRYVARGTSRTMRSKHLLRPSKAVDLGVIDPATGALTWEVEPFYHGLGRAGKQAAEELGIEITWGGDWGWDWGHFELP